jgi:2-polyprenyl-3-methyl-5-hydroxy-6-metoxy-1,4-benzoquinol methylase
MTKVATTTPIAVGAAEEIDAGERFAFGANWRRFLDLLNDQRIEAACGSLVKRLGRADFDGLTFLDAGCGSGLFSLAANRLGAARVHSFDFDPEGVACARELRSRYGSSVGEWQIELGNVLDPAYVGSLGAFDVVYSWGVLHHTGNMWLGMENVTEAVKPGGVLFISLYNDQGRRTKFWRSIKRGYNRLPERWRVPYTLAVMTPFEARNLLSAARHRDLGGFVRRWREPEERGMNAWVDWVDWVGGYPYEVARADDVFAYYHERGFALTQLVLRGSGCNEYVFVRR